MSIIATAGDSKTYLPAPAGTHQAVCVDVIDLGEQPDAFNPGKMKHAISIVWQLPELIPDGNGERFTVGKKYRLSLNERAILRHDLESWRGRPFTRTEEQGFDVETIIGANCLINIAQVTKGEGAAAKVYGNVVSIMPLMRGVPPIKAVDYIRRKDRPTEPSGQQIPAPTAQQPTPFEQRVANLAKPASTSGFVQVVPDALPPPLAPLNLPQAPAGPIMEDSIPF